MTVQHKRVSYRGAPIPIFASKSLPISGILDRSRRIWLKKTKQNPSDFMCISFFLIGSNPHTYNIRLKCQSPLPCCSFVLAYQIYVGYKFSLHLKTVGGGELKTNGFMWNIRWIGSVYNEFYQNWNQIGGKNLNRCTLVSNDTTSVHS